MPPPAPEELTLASAPTLWAGREVEHSRSLGFLAPTPHVELAPEDARDLGVESGDEVELTVAGERAQATARVRTGVPAGSVFLTPPGVLPEGPVEVAPRASREPLFAGRPPDGEHRS